VRVSTTNEFHAPTFEEGPEAPGGTGEGSTLDIFVFGISYHCPTASALTQTGSAPGGGNTDTTTDAFPVPFGPVQVRLNCVVLVSPPEDWVPEVAKEPDQPPEAAHEVVLVDDQVSVDDPPLVTDGGFAAKEMVGCAVTVTVVVALCVPPGPVQERLKVLLFASAPVDVLPDVG